MCREAVCFTSSGSNGSGWVVLVFPCLFFPFLEKRVFSPIRDLRQNKKVYATCTKKKISVETKPRLLPKKKVTYVYFYNQATLSSAVWRSCPALFSVLFLSAHRLRGCRKKAFPEALPLG